MAIDSYNRQHTDHKHPSSLPDRTMSNCQLPSEVDILAEITTCTTLVLVSRYKSLKKKPDSSEK